MPVKKRRLNELTKRGREKSQSHRHSEPGRGEPTIPARSVSPWELSCESNFLNAGGSSGHQIVFIIFCLKD